MAEKAIRDKILRETPDWRSILAGNTELAFSTQDILNSENDLIEDLIREVDLEQLVSRYPIRETPALDIVSRALGFQSQSKYEQAVRKTLIDSEDARQLVIGILQLVANLILE